MRFLTRAAFVGLALSLTPVASYAQGADEPSTTSRLDGTGTFRFEASLQGGAGFESHDVGTAERNDDPSITKDITISGGGGFGASFGVSYGLAPAIEVGVLGGYQESSISPQIENGDGAFDRGFVRGTVRYKVPVSAAGHLKLGGGAGIYAPGDLDLDFSDAPDGAHILVGYDTAPGFHLETQYEHFLNRKPESSMAWSVVVGACFSRVMYDCNSCTIDGVEVPPDTIEDVLVDGLRDFDGSGFDLQAAVALSIL